MSRLGWDRPDVILVTGDAYIDSPHIGVAMIGRLLQQAGYRVGIIGQPDIHSGRDIQRLGEPRLFWGVTGGCVDSMVANYTALKKKRRSDDYTPGGRNNRRPDRAVIAYSNLIKRYFKDTVPIVLGGVEASMRRIAHYDYWSDRIRRSILFDAKADFLVYGMGERAALLLTENLEKGQDVRGIRGLCYVSREKPKEYVELPSFERVVADQGEFMQMFKRFYANNDPVTARGLCQKQDSRYLIQNPPAGHLTQDELDAVYDMEFERAVHPYYRRVGPVKGLETIRFSITSHRGCYGECSFCAIGVHEGRTVRWRSEKSIEREARRITELEGFKGNISDVGGPTVNMYGFECDKKLTHGNCARKRCLYPSVCRQLHPDHSRQTRLLKRLRRIPGVKRVFVGSGMRHDLVMADRKHGEAYLNEVVRHHVSGQLKIAPEHVSAKVLTLMGKPGNESLVEFRRLFIRSTEAAGKQQYLTYYLIAAHPGCGEREMRQLKWFVSRTLKINPRQVQIFTPLPSTHSAVMYYTGRDPFTGRAIYVERGLKGKSRQKRILTPGR